MAARIGSLSLAYQYFNVALRADISDLHGNTSEGVHAASLGGVWSAVFHGFAGILMNNDHLSFNPFMPNTWKKIKLSFIWRGIIFKVESNNNMVKIEASTSKKQKIKVKVFDKTHKLEPNKEHKFLRPKKRIIENYYL